MIVLDARTATPHYPGVGRYTRELARALAPVTELALIVNPLQSGLERELWSLPARRVSVPHAPRSIAQQWALPARLRGLKALVYHSPFYLMPYLPGLPTVVTAFDLIPLHPASGTPRSQQSAYALAHRLAFMSARRIVTLSDASRQAFIERFGLRDERIVTVAPGLTSRFVPPEPEDLRNARQKLNLPGQYLLSVGINKPHKNLVALVQAYARLPVDAPPLLICGPQDSRYLEVRAAAAQLGSRVRLLGRVPDDLLPALYGGAHWYVHPALAEGFGFPVLEAMGCGAPVVCSDIPVLREVTQNGAVYCDPNDSEAMAATLRQVLDDTPLRQAVAERGLKRARYFTWDRAAERMLNLYAQVCAP